VFINFVSFFLVLLFVVSLRIDFGKLLTGKEEEANERRGPPPNPVELAVRFRLELFLSEVFILDYDLCSRIYLGRNKTIISRRTSSIYGKIKFYFR